MPAYVSMMFARSRNIIYIIVLAIFTGLFSSCATGGYSRMKYSRFQVNRKYQRPGMKKRKNYRYVRHIKPISKAYIIKNKRRDRGW